MIKYYPSGALHAALEHISSAGSTQPDGAASLAGIASEIRGRSTEPGVTAENAIEQLIADKLVCVSFRGADGLSGRDWSAARVKMLSLGQVRLSQLNIARGGHKTHEAKKASRRQEITGVQNPLTASRPADRSGSHDADNIASLQFGQRRAHKTCTGIGEMR